MAKSLRVLPCALLIAAAPLWAQQPAAPPAASAPMPAGDAARGKALYDANQCADCHRVGDIGSHLGPDLSDIGGRRTPDRLKQALVAPDDEVLPEHRFVKAVTKSGESVTGRLLNQDAISVQIVTPKDQLKSYLKANLREFALTDKGMMPPVKLSDQQINDLVNYLGSLKPEAGK